MGCLHIRFSIVYGESLCEILDCDEWLCEQEAVSTCRQNFWAKKEEDIITVIKEEILQDDQFMWS